MIWVKMVPKQRPSEATTVPAGIRLCGAGQRGRTIGESKLSVWLEQLKKQYPGIVFHLAQEKDAGDLAALAVQAGTGVHSVSVPGIVGRMGQQREDFSQCWSELVSAAGTLSANRDRPGPWEHF